MFRFFPLVAISFSSFVTAYAQKSLPLSYRFSMDTAGAELHVSLTFKGDQSGHTVLELPDQWAGQEAFYRAVKDLSVSGKRAALSSGEDSSERVITYHPGAELTVHYTLKQDWEGELNYPNNFRGVLQKNYLQFTGYSLFVTPKYDQSQRVQVKLDWGAMPAGWTIANSLHAGSRFHKSTVMIGDLVNGVYTAGDFRLHTTHIRKKPVFVAVRGNSWKFSDSMLVNRIATILTMERRFWNDYSEPYYFVSLIPFAGQISHNGTSLHQAFMLGMSTDVTVDADLDWLLTHEYFHRWNGTMIRLREQIEQENSWFSEGFTEYYSYKLLYESGILTADEYLAKTNAMIAAYYLSPVRNDDKKTLGTNYWNTREYQQIPYKKGFVYALYIDRLIRNAGEGHTLDQLMFDLRDAQRRGQELTDTSFVQLLNRYIGAHMAAEQERYIHTGETIPILPGSFFSAELTLVDLGPFDVGFDINASIDAKQITGVKPESEAWKAGLRDGQSLAGYSIYGNDISRPCEIDIEENGEKRTISYIPMSGERVAVPQFK